MTPLVSIIMPVKNGSNYLREALNFIKAQNVDIEIIVVNDGSTDDTHRIAESFGCVILTHQNSKGLVASKNTALKVARGKYVMFHDHDDLLTEGALQKMLQEIQIDDGAFAVMAQLQDFFSPELPIEEAKRVVVRSEPYFGLFSAAILIKKEVFDVIGLFDENIQAGDIIEWNGKMQTHHLPIKRMEFVSSKRRIHNTNYGRTNKGTEYKDYAALLRAKLKRAQ
jgi:glycosyltransferase involved in cell wall biosynthesis